MKSVPPRGSGWVLSIRVLFFAETRPLPRGGTDLIAHAAHVLQVGLQPIPKSFRGRPDKFAKSGRKMTLAREASPQCDVSDRQVCI